MSNTRPSVRPASPSAPVSDGSVGLSHSWRPPSPGSARRTAKSARGRPSTCHYREEDHQEQLSWGPLVTRWEVRKEEGWTVAAAAFQSAAASSARWWEEGNSVPPPRRLWELWVGGSHLLSSALRQQSPRSTRGGSGCQWIAAAVGRPPTAESAHGLHFKHPVISS